MWLTHPLIATGLGAFLLLGVGLGAVPGRIGFAANGQKLNDLIGRGVAIADFDGDGALDAFVANQVTWGSQDCRVYHGDGRGQFADSGQRLAAPATANQPLVLDLDANAVPDVMVGRATWINDGRGRFTPGPAVIADADGAPVYGMQLADMNADGAVDLVATILDARRAAAVRLYLNDRAGRFREAGQTPVPGIAGAVAVGDLNGDRAPDVVVTGWRAAAADGCPNRVLLGDGAGHLRDSGQQLDEQMRHSHSVALGDLDRDGDLDIVLVTQASMPARIYVNDGRGRYTAGASLGTSSVEKVALADFDRDGDLDIFLACLGADEVWVNDGAGRFADSTLRLGAEWSWELAIGDFNGDRQPDVFVVNFAVDRGAPPERQTLPRPVDVWLNTTARPVVR